MKTEELNIDIQNAPPSTDQLADLRKNATRTLERGKLRGVIFKVLSAVIIIFIMVALLYFWSSGALSEKDASSVLIPVLVAIFVFVIVGIISGNLILSFAIVDAMIIALALSLSLSFAGAGAGMFWLVFAFAGSVAAVRMVDKYIIIPNQNADGALEVLCELNADEHPDQCIEFDTLREHDQVTRDYFTRCADMKRKPVIAELDELKSWVGEAEKRLSAEKKQQAAREACGRMVNDSY